MNTPEKKRYTIGIMLGDIQSDYSEDLISGFYTCAREEDVNLIFLMGPQAPLYCTDILLSNDNGHYHYQFDTIYDYAHFSKLGRDDHRLWFAFAVHTQQQSGTVFKQLRGHSMPSA